MTQKHDGGPAYPTAAEGETTSGRVLNYEGMSLRDAAAIQFISGMLAHSTRYRPRQEDAGIHWHEAIAREGLQIADAFIAARSGGET